MKLLSIQFGKIPYKIIIVFIKKLDCIERYPSKPYTKDGFPQNLTVVMNRTAKFECPQIIADLEPYIEWIFLGNYSDVTNDGVHVNGTLLQVARLSNTGEGNIKA